MKSSSYDVANTVCGKQKFQSCGEIESNRRFEVSGGITMGRGLVRRVLLVAASILNWIFSIGYIREIYNVMLGKNLIKYVDNINIDGSDFTPLANLTVAGVNGLTIFLVIGSAVLFATIFILIFAILLREIGRAHV